MRWSKASIGDSSNRAKRCQMVSYWWVRNIIRTLMNRLHNWLLKKHVKLEIGQTPERVGFCFSWSRCPFGWGGLFTKDNVLIKSKTLCFEQQLVNYFGSENVQVYNTMKKYLSVSNDVSNRSNCNFYQQVKKILPKGQYMLYVFSSAK